MLDMTGEADGPPMIPGNTIADNAGGGMNAAISILAALLSRERTGVGQYIDMAMVDGLVTMMFFPIEEHLTTGAVPHRSGTIRRASTPGTASTRRRTANTFPSARLSRGSTRTSAGCWSWRS